MINCCEAKGVLSLICTCSTEGIFIGVEKVFFPSDIMWEIRDRSSFVNV